MPPDGDALTFRGELDGPTRTPATPAGDAALVPIAFFAFTVKEYDFPLVNPLMTQDCFPPVEHVCFPGLAVTVYWVMGLPPSLVGAVQETFAVPGLGYFAVTTPGESGAVTGTVTGTGHRDDGSGCLLRIHSFALRQASGLRRMGDACVLGIQSNGRIHRS